MRSVASATASICVCAHAVLMGNLAQAGYYVFVNVHELCLYVL